MTAFADDRYLGHDEFGAWLHRPMAEAPQPAALATIGTRQRGRFDLLRFDRRCPIHWAPDPILPFAPGDEIELRMPGGAGFGAAAERRREALQRDLPAGFNTAASAREAYGYDSNERREDVAS